MKHDEALARLWRHIPSDKAATPAARLRALVHYAVLAPSSHNTQCWRFRLSGDDRITVLPDSTRRCPVVDPDDHHLHVSVGCAVENIVQAAPAFGLAAQVHIGQGPEAGVKVDLRPGPTHRSTLFEAITLRQCTRGDFDGQPLSSTELAALQQAGTGDGVSVHLITEPAPIEAVVGLVVQGHEAQVHDPAFMQELKSWVRFNDAEAMALGDGLSGQVSGKPSAPHWIGSLIFGTMMRLAHDEERYAAQIRSSAGVAVFVSRHDDWQHRIEAGRGYERFALQATALGIRNAFVNQPVEVAALRPKFAQALALGAGRPDLVVRFGRGPAMPRSLRRPLADVLVD